MTAIRASSLFLPLPLSMIIAWGAAVSALPHSVIFAATIGLLGFEIAVNHPSNRDQEAP